MLTIYVRDDDLWDDEKQVFVTPEATALVLEHSLVSLSKWEQKFKKPFLGDGEKTDEETLEYVKLMILTPDFPPEVFSKLSQNNVDEINDYINDKMTATWFRDTKGPAKTSEQITSELIYYWMIAFGIWLDCENWHLNRLFTLIRVCSAKNQKPTKTSRADQMAERRRLNEERRKQHGTSG